MKQVFTSSIRKRFEDPQLLTLGASNAVARDALETPAGREPGRTHHPACFLAASNMRGTLRGQAASHSTPGLSGIIGTYDQDTQIAAIKQRMTVTAPSDGCVCVCGIPENPVTRLEYGANPAFVAERAAVAGFGCVRPIQAPKHSRRQPVQIL
jgi:hypothetical protein